MLLLYLCLCYAYVMMHMMIKKIKNRQKKIKKNIKKPKKNIVVAMAHMPEAT